MLPVPYSDHLKVLSHLLLHLIHWSRLLPLRSNKGVFTLGKERKKVDYCISDNSSVSRTHAEVVAKNGTFYLIDQKSTNGTYLNDVRLNPLQEMELKNGDKIRISDETFVFKLM